MKTAVDSIKSYAWNGKRFSGLAGLFHDVRNTDFAVEKTVREFARHGNGQFIRPVSKISEVLLDVFEQPLGKLLGRQPHGKFTCRCSPTCASILEVGTSNVDSKN